MTPVTEGIFSIPNYTTILKVKPIEDRESEKLAVKRSLQPLLIISQFLSSAPFPSMALHPVSHDEGTCSTLGGILQIVWAIVLLSGAIVSAIYKRIWRFDSVDMPFLIYLLFNLELFLGIFITLIVFVGCQLKRTTHDEILTQLVDMMVIFKKVDQAIDLDLLRQLGNKMLTGAGTFFGIIIAVDAVYHQHIGKSACGTGAYLLPHAVQTITLFQYGYVLVYAYRQFKTMNTFLLSLRFALKNDLINYIRHLETMRKQHMELHRLVFKMNQLFGIFHIVSIILVLTATSIACLEVYQKIQFENTGLYLAYSALWVVLHCSKLILILYPNYLVENERDLTGILLHGIPQCDNQQYNVEVKMFTRQVVHQKGSYSACGIVDLNLSVLASIFGAMTTFLIILIEFDKSSKAPK
ncbi:uncharacterized protein LOC131434216 [Malaya genurostris]|uniref:uncharacterized protein LOC131434216 n=1 Tax=Malaya genurostris TaxID=325434 RepID=UPI0026F3F7E9|nr:uncharacterized protein LOC131434216 [Malaya genurostris]